MASWSLPGGTPRIAQSSRYTFCAMPAGRRQRVRLPERACALVRQQIVNAGLSEASSLIMGSLFLA
jgi:hypothetical protein